MDVETSSGHIRSYKTSEFSLLEILQSLLARLLWNIAMQNARLLMRDKTRPNNAAQTLLTGKLVATLLHVAKNDRASVHSAVHLD